MIKIYLSILINLPFLAFSQQTYNGNTKNGFGGTVGEGSLTIAPFSSTDPVTGTRAGFNFTFTKGTTGQLNDAVVLYLDLKSTGFT